MSNHPPLATAVLQSLPQPVIVCDEERRIVFVNYAAEAFFSASLSVLSRQKLDDLIAFGSPITGLVAAVAERRAPMTEYRVHVGSSRFGNASDDRIVDVFATPISDSDGRVALLFQERTMADKIDRQLVSRGAARSVTGLASMLAHEIKNPLSGIRGAAQLLEQYVPDADRELTQLICEETDRICALVDRMEEFADGRPIEREPVNIHQVLGHVRKVAQNGFGRDVRFVETYDPSLPAVYGNRDQLIQVFLNLVKNACEANPEPGAEIVLTTAYRQGVRLALPGTRQRVHLPLSVQVLDNGPGIPEELRPHLFDAFITSKPNGRGLGLALVAKIVNDHGGVIEFDSEPRRTVFNVMLPVYSETGGRRIASPTARAGIHE